MSKTSDDSGKISWWWLGLLFGGVSVAWGGYWWILWFSGWFLELEKGQFGDAFGALNTLFSGLAFAGVIYAIILQKKELALQREELEKTRKEIKGQKQTLQKQNFESSFFQLLSLHNDIVNSMEVPKSFGAPYQGRECFGSLLDEFKKEYRGAEENFCAGWEENPDEARQLRLKWIDEKYKELFDRYQQCVGYYFRALYNFVKFVDQEKVFPKNCGDKKFYTNLIRAQLSSDELGLLFYNCLSERGAKFKVLVEKYALLEDMDFKKLVKKQGEGYAEFPLNEDHKNLYDKSAYGESE